MPDPDEDASDARFMELLNAGVAQSTSGQFENFPREPFPDVVARTYWGRTFCLVQCGDLQAACNTIGDLIEEVGSGTTPVRVKALDAAIAHCSGTDEPDLRTRLHEAEQKKESLRARVRPVR